MKKSVEFTSSDFERLRKRFGTHSKVAAALHVSADHYGRIRKKQAASGPLGVLLGLFLEQGEINTAAYDQKITSCAISDIQKGRQ